MTEARIIAQFGTLAPPNPFSRHPFQLCPRVLVAQNAEHFRKSKSGRLHCTRNEEQAQHLSISAADSRNLRDPGFCETSGSDMFTRQSETTRGTQASTSFTAGNVVTAILLAVLTGAFFFVDTCIWQIIRRPVGPAVSLTKPFLISLVSAGVLGHYGVPLLSKLKAQQVLRKEGPAAHAVKAGTPTMGGVFFVPVGVAVSLLATRSFSAELVGAATVTLLFSGIGFLDDVLSIFKKHNYGVPGRMKLLLEFAAGIWFFFWFSLAPPYKLRTVVPLPRPVGLWNIGKWYLPLTAFCFASMANGVNLTDGLDGLAAGTAALAFAGMAVAVLTISPALAVFGSTMAGACAGFLLHNRHKASVFMGDTGSLALGGSLAAMACCTGLFLPLFVASGVFVVETVSVIVQVAYVKYTKRVYGTARRLLRMSPFHHHLEHLGVHEMDIVAGAYLASFVLALLAAITALISVQ